MAITMGFDIDQLLLTEELSLQDLDEFYASLENDLVETNQNYVYAIAKLKQIETQIRQSSNNLNQDITELQQQHNSLTNSAIGFKKHISTLQANLVKVSEQKKSFQIHTPKVSNDKGLNKSLGLIDTSMLINAIEYPVIQEVRSQIHNLPPETQEQVNLVEVVAYSLNRLPSMYATTKDAYRQLYNTANGELHPKIVDTVRRGIRKLLIGDPLRDSFTIPDEVFCDPAGLLSRLCQLFDRKQLRWKEVPSVLHSLMFNNSSGDLLEETAPEQQSGFLNRRSQASHITSYLKRSKLRTNVISSADDTSGSSWKEEAKEAERAEMFQQLFQLYSLKGKLKYINLSEKFLMVASLHLMAGLSSDEVDLIEVVAHALNQYPPMYATSERGLTFLRQKCQTKLPDFIEQIRKSFAWVKYSTRLADEPLYFAEFNNEYREALPALSKMLDREDLNPDNLVDVIKNFIE